jgi:TPR repeat protein
VQKKRFIRRRVAFDNPETKIISFCEPAQAREFEGQSSIMGRAAVAGAALLSWLAVASAQSANTLAGMEAYNRGDVAAAYRLLDQEAKSGDPEAQVNLGYLFARGQGVFANQGEALRLYSLSAAQGDGEGMNAVGYKYQYGTGVNKDIDVAVHWYCKAVEAGNARGMNNLAILLSDGLGVPKDEEQARDLWRQSAALGHINAMANLAFSYLQSESAKRDQKQGLAWMERAAERGQQNAQVYLRSSGYTGPLPPPFGQAAQMLPAPRGVAGHARICEIFIS